MIAAIQLSKQYFPQFNNFCDQTTTKVKDFFNSYRDVVNQSLYCASWVATAAYWNGVITEEGYKVMVLGTVLSSIGFNTCDTIASTINVDLLDEKGVDEKLGKLREMGNTFQEMKNMDPKRKIYHVGKELFKTALEIARVRSESIVYPQLIIPRILNFVSSFWIKNLSDDKIHALDDVVLLYLEKGRWNEYQNIDEFNRNVEPAMIRLVFRGDLARFKEMAPKYEAFLHQYNLADPNSRWNQFTKVDLQRAGKALEG